MNGSLSDSSEKSFEGDDDVEEEYVTPKCDELLHLSNLVNELSYDPAVPNNVTQAYLQKAGMQNPSPDLVNLISIAAQKLISDIAVDALTHNKMRQSLCGKKKNSRKFVMNTEDLLEALKDKGISVKKQPYF